MEKDKITAEEFLTFFEYKGQSLGEDINYPMIEECMRQFAKLKVQEALEAAHRNMQLPEEDLEFTLSSYDLNEIK